MNLFTRWKDRATDFVDVRLGLFKLSLIERTSTLLGTLIISIIYLFIALAVLTFLGLGLMETFISILDHSEGGARVGGAFITAGIFALLLLLLFVLRKMIVGAFAGIFIKILTSGDEDDESKEQDGRRVKVEGD